MEEKRVLQFDLLRIFACFSVVMLHCASQFWYDREVSTGSWLVANTYDAIFRFGVPIFFMISGTLFLSPKREITIKRLYLHNILRLFTAYVCWSGVYGLWKSKDFPLEQTGIKPVIVNMLMGEYHLWFVPALAGIYMLVPILRTWLAHAKKKEVEYFLSLFLLFQIGRETLLFLIPFAPVRQFLISLPVEMVCSYMGYFILGYYICHIGLSDKLKKWIYPLGVLGVIGAAGLSSAFSLYYGEPRADTFDSFSIFTFLVTLAVFYFFYEKMDKWNNRKGFQKVVLEISSATFGIYLLHILVIELLMKWGMEDGNMIVGIPLMALCCFGICFVITALLRRVPILGRYLL